MIKSPNFSFLSGYDSLLLDLAAAAERYCFADPVAALTRLRLLGETMALQTAAAVAALPNQERAVDFSTALRLLEDKNAMSRETAQVFHHLRQVGNRAVHENAGSRGDALHALRLAQRAAIWFHRTLTDPKFKTPVFVPPPEPERATAALAYELNQLRERLAAAQVQASTAVATAAQEAARRREAEEKVAKTYADLEAAFSLAAEAEEKLVAKQSRLALELVQQTPPDDDSAKATVKKGQKADIALSAELDEAETRGLIDAQLRATGWEADTTEIRFSNGTRPVANRYLAIAEWPTATGPVDYALFHGKTLLGLIEAKKASVDVPGVLGQTKRYSRGFRMHDPGEYAVASPWNPPRVIHMLQHCSQHFKNYTPTRPRRKGTPPMRAKASTTSIRPTSRPHGWSPNSACCVGLIVQFVTAS